MKKIKIIVLSLSLLFIYNCSSLTLKPVSYAWPIESVLNVKPDGTVEDPRYAIKFNALQIFAAEYEKAVDIDGAQVRIIRGNNGYYFVTSQGFKNVYIFSSGDGELNLENTIKVSDFGMESPAMNQRIPNIEVLDGNNKILLNHQGIIGK